MPMIYTGVTPRFSSLLFCIGCKLKIRLLLTAICLSGVFFFCHPAGAEITSPTVELSSEESHDLFGLGDPQIPEEHTVPTSSVPEPTTFGLIAMALAVGGGLIVRRKTD